MISVWEGNVELLEHEQRALVQPNFDRLSCSSAWLVAIGSATSFEVRGVRREIADFTSFYLYSLTRGIPPRSAVRAWPRITRFDDRWRWIVTSIVPRFRRFDARHLLGRRQPATHLRRSARLRVEPCTTSCRVHPRTGHGELRRRGDGTGHGPNG